MKHRYKITTFKERERFNEMRSWNFYFKFHALFARLFLQRYSDRKIWFDVIPKIEIDCDTEVEWCDDGPWRNYQLEASGDTLEQVLKSAQITEIDQDGGDLATYGLEEAPQDVELAGKKIIYQNCFFK